MVQITARKTADENVSSLSVCIKNRILGINTYVSLKLKIKTKEWSNEVQLPRHPTDQRPVPELRGMSYAELSDRLVAIKKELSSAEDCGALTVDYAKTVIMQIINKEFVKELQEVASRQEQETKKQQRITLMEWIEEGNRGQWVAKP